MISSLPWLRLPEIVKQQNKNRIHESNVLYRGAAILAAGAAVKLSRGFCNKFYKTVQNICVVIQMIGFHQNLRKRILNCGDELFSYQLEHTFFYVFFLEKLLRRGYISHDKTLRKLNEQCSV